MGISAPGMNTTTPTPAFCTEVARTASRDSGRRTKGKASAKARRLSLQAAMIHSPMRRSSVAAPSASSGMGSASAGSVSTGRACSMSSMAASAALAASTAAAFGASLAVLPAVMRRASARAASPKGVGLVMFGATMSPSGTGQPAASAAAATAWGAVVATMTGMPAPRMWAACSPMRGESPATMTAMSSAP